MQDNCIFAGMASEKPCRLAAVQLLLAQCKHSANTNLQVQCHAVVYHTKPFLAPVHTKEHVSLPSIISVQTTCCTPDVLQLQQAHDGQ